ncbi:MAG: aspartyl-phosphate phosphatase Spo0E family protein [Clostridia bacterium]|nr:aspartyl-phosphate phosphatase Spo0E family protein [Clostridia bacterium]
MVTMLIDQICDLRDKLNKSILTKDYKDTYELSLKLDKLIAEYYKSNKEVQKKQFNFF